jgi:hypothetical protein
MNIVPYQDIEKMAKEMADSGLTAFKTKAQAITYMMIAQAEGRHPASVAKDYHFIEGKATLKADAILARYMESGGKVKWIQFTNEIVEASFEHPKGADVTLSWTQEDAELAELTRHENGKIKKDNWRKFPRAMLRTRLVSEAIRMSYPTVISGMYTPEEIEQISMHEERDITPKEINEVISITTYYKLKNIIQAIGIPAETQRKWCEEENVQSLELISESYANEIIIAAQVRFPQILENKDNGNVDTIKNEISNEKE